MVRMLRATMILTFTLGICVHYAASGQRKQYIQAETIRSNRCEGVTISFAHLPLDRGARNEVIRTTFEILLKRLEEMVETEGIDYSLFIMSDDEDFVLESPSRSCEELAMLAGVLTERTHFALGLSGDEPTFTSDDLETAYVSTERDIHLKLKPAARNRFRRFTADNIGKMVSMRFGASETPVDVRIEAVQTSGEILFPIDRTDDSSGSLEIPLLTELIVGGCRECTGAYE